MVPNPYDGCPKSDLLAFPGPWRFALPRTHVILVTDEELETLTDPDAQINLSIQLEPRMRSLRQICEEAQAKGGRTLIIAFDHFFRQYRPGQKAPRRLMPDSDEYIEKIAVISKFAAQYGLGLELSLLSPLEIGKAYAAQTGESGRWMHYRKGIRDPQTGAFSVQLWKQRRWCNNKGPIDIPDAGVRAFAFEEEPVAGTPFRVVDPDKIVEVTDCVSVDAWEGAENKVGDYWSQRVRIHGQ